MELETLERSQAKNLDRLSNLHMSEALPTARGFRAELYQHDLFVLCRHGLGFQDISWQTHGPIIEMLESPSKKKLIVVPRGTLKSSIACVGYPIRRLLNNPNERILIDSELYTNSKNFIRGIRGHLQSDHLVNLYGDLLSGFNESELTVRGRTKVLKEASITAGGVGTVKVGQHYDTIIFDDLNSNKNSMNPEQRHKVIEHFKYMFSVLEPGGTVVVTATRYAEDDVPGFILHQILGIKEIQYGCILSDDTRKSLRADSVLTRYL